MSRQHTTIIVQHTTYICFITASRIPGTSVPFSKCVSVVAEEGLVSIAALRKGFGYPVTGISVVLHGRVNLSSQNGRKHKQLGVEESEITSKGLENILFCIGIRHGVVLGYSKDVLPEVATGGYNVFQEVHVKKRQVYCAAIALTSRLVGLVVVLTLLAPVKHQYPVRMNPAEGLPVL